MTEDAVMTLFTEPGSKGEETDQVAQLADHLASDVLGRVEGVVVGDGDDFAGLGVEDHGRDVVGLDRSACRYLLLDVETGCRRRGSAARSSDPTPGAGCGSRPG